MKQSGLRSRYGVLPAMLVALAGATSIDCAVAADTATPMAVVGKAAPAFTLKDAFGKTVSLKNFSHKIVVLEWFDDVCPFVKKHYKSGNMQKLQKEFAGKGIIWLVINSSGAGRPGSHNEAESQELIKNWKFVAPHFLLDAKGVVGHEYGAKTTPHMFIIGKDGKLLYNGAIDDKPDTDVESIAGAKNYVREALTEVLQGKSITIAETRPYG